MAEHAIVVCADDRRLLVELPEQLRPDGYRPHTAQARRQLMWALAERQPDAVVLGGLPSLSETLRLLRELRAHEAGGRVGVDPEVPVLVLSAATELCELRAFEAGADDFQPASVSYLLLRARLGALIARSRITAPRQARRGRVAAHRHLPPRGQLRRAGA
jgi:DNA-binding response OmpR family regulator